MFAKPLFWKVEAIKKHEDEDYLATGAWNHIRGEGITSGFDFRMRFFPLKGFPSFTTSFSDLILTSNCHFRHTWYLSADRSTLKSHIKSRVLIILNQTELLLQNSIRIRSGEKCGLVHLNLFLGHKGKIHSGQDLFIQNNISNYRITERQVNSLRHIFHYWYSAWGK